MLRCGVSKYYFRDCRYEDPINRIHPQMLLNNSCSTKLRKFHWKTYAMDTFLAKVSGGPVSNYQSNY